MAASGLSRLIRTAAACLALMGAAAALPRPAAATAEPPVLRLETGAHVAAVTRVIDAGDGTIVTASEDKTVRLWSAADGSAQGVLRVPVGPGDAGALYALAVSPRYIAAAGRTTVDGATQVHVFERAGERMIGSIAFGTAGAVTAAAFSPDGKHLAVGLERGGLRVIDFAASRLAGQDGDYSYGVTWITYAPDGRLAVSAPDGIRLYGPGLTLQGRAERLEGTEPWALAFTPNGERLAVGSIDDAVVRVLAVPSLAVTGRLTGGAGATGNLAAVAWDVDGRTLWAAGTYRVSGRQALRRFDSKGEGRDIGLPGDDTVLDLATRKGGGVAYASAAAVWGLVAKPGHLVNAAERALPDFRDAYETGFAVSADGARVRFALSRGGKLAEFDLMRRSLVMDPPADPALKAPQAAAGGTIVADWRNSNQPSVAGRAVPLGANETSRAAAVTPDGKAVLLGSDFHLRAFTGGREAWKVLLPAPAYTVAWSGDGRVALAALGDGTVRWYDRKDGRELLALFAHGDGKRWIVWTPDGFFDHGSNGERLIGYQVNRGVRTDPEFVAIDQMYDRYYRRDLVLASFGGKAVEVTAERKVDAVLQRGLPPRVEIAEICDAGGAACRPAAGVVDAPADQITLRLKVTDRGGGLGPITVRREVAVVATAPAGGSPKVRLAPGDNALTVSSVTADGAIEAKDEDRARLVVRWTPPPAQPAAPPATQVTQAAPPKTQGATVTSRGDAAKPEAGTAGPGETTLFVLSVGVSDYIAPPMGEANLDLYTAADDARAIAEIMRSGTGSVYQRTEITLLEDHAATTKAIDAAFADIQKRARPTDMVLVFFAGHGKSIDGRYHFLPAELGTGDPALYKRFATATTAEEYYQAQDTLFRSEGIGQDMLTDWLQNIPATRVLVMLDTCYAGSATISESAEQVDSVTATNTVGQKIGRLVLAGARNAAADADESGEHGLFTQVALDGLKGAADYRNTGVVRAHLLADFVKSEVPVRAQRVAEMYGVDNFVQEPEFYFTGKDFFELRPVTP